MARPHRPLAVAAHREVEPRVAEARAGRDDREGAVRVRLGAHDDDRVPVRQREDDLHAGAASPRHRRQPVAPRVEHVAAPDEPAEPRGVAHGAGARVRQLQHLARDAAARVEPGERDVELLQPPAEQPREQPPERPERPRPLGPRVELVGGGALVELGHAGVDGARVEVGGGERGEVGEQAGVGGAAEREPLALGEPLEDVGADPLGVARGAVEPRRVGERDAAAGGLHPALRDPVGEVAAARPEPEHGTKSTDRPRGRGGGTRPP